MVLRVHCELMPPSMLLLLLDVCVLLFVYVVVVSM